MSGSTKSRRYAENRAILGFSVLSPQGRTGWQTRILAVERGINSLTGAARLRSGNTRSPTIPSKRADIGPAEVQEARAAAEARSYTSGNPLIIADNISRGLSLRVQGGSASWILKFAGRTKSLGNLAEIRTAKAARELAGQTRALMRDGDDVNTYVRSRQAGKDHDKAKAKIATEQARAASRWTWDLATQYADVYLSNARMTTRGIVKQPSLSTAAEARRYLMMEEAKPLFGRLLSELRPGDLEEVRDACEKSGRKTASRQFVAYAKGALSFARKKHSRSAGLEGAPKWWLEVEKLDSTIPAPRSRHPSLKTRHSLWFRH